MLCWSKGWPLHGIGHFDGAEYIVPFACWEHFHYPYWLQLSLCTVSHLWDLDPVRAYVEILPNKTLLRSTSRPDVCLCVFGEQLYCDRDRWAAHTGCCTPRFPFFLPPFSLFGRGFRVSPFLLVQSHLMSLRNYWSLKRTGSGRRERMERRAAEMPSLQRACSWQEQCWHFSLALCSP